jgi:hypothetical protein
MLTFMTLNKPFMSLTDQAATDAKNNQEKFVQSQFSCFFANKLCFEHYDLDQLRVVVILLLEVLG